LSSVASQFAAGIDQAMTSLGVYGTYTCGDTEASLTLPVVLSAPGSMVSEGGVILTAEAWEVRLRASDLVFDGDAYEPVVGDTIAVTSAGVTTTYEVLMPPGQKDCWSWSDRFQVRRIVYVKRIATPAPPEE
jgi:hypothetical protein